MSVIDKSKFKKNFELQIKKFIRMAVIFTRNFCPVTLQKSRSVSMVCERDRIGRKNAQIVWAGVA